MATIRPTPDLADDDIEFSGRAFRKALRKYRREVTPMAKRDECSWRVLALIGVAAAAILLASAWGYML